jgi:hypothetical protein
LACFRGRKEYGGEEKSERCAAGARQVKIACSRGLRDSFIVAVTALSYQQSISSVAEKRIAINAENKKLPCFVQITSFLLQTKLGGGGGQMKSFVFQDDTVSFILPI